MVRGVHHHRRGPVPAVAAGHTAQGPIPRVPEVNRLVEVAVLVLAVDYVGIGRIDQGVEAVAAEDLLPVAHPAGRGAQGAVVLGPAIEPRGILVIHLDHIELVGRLVVELVQDVPELAER